MKYNRKRRPYARKRRNSRRNYRRRAAPRRATMSPDGPVKEKITIRYEVFFQNALITPPAQQINVRWNKANYFDTAGSNTNVVYVTNNDQFDQVSKNYSFYYTYGMGMKFMPSLSNAATDAAPRIVDVEIGSGLSSLQSGDDQSDPAVIRNCKDYKIYNGHRHVVKRYYRIGKYLKGIKVGWLPVGQELAAQD